MVIIGLTGSIAMGKSTAAKVFRRIGVPVYDADRAVHRALARGGAAVSAVEKAFPGSVKDGAVDRTALGARVFGDQAALRRLEGIVHPIVRRAQDRFLRRQSARRKQLVVLDIPLLLESGGHRRVDAIVVVSAPKFIQAQRVLARPGMTRARLKGILERQLPDREKRRRADFVVLTGLGKRSSLRKLRRIVNVLRGRRGLYWPPRARFRRRHA
ncbi:MAG TPA: dephospho-CoA kinase [Alphaproteobacteria bacterium]|nr:dephospho-CoA kinase [Alphaproteobacteria bacterium]